VCCILQYTSTKRPGLNKAYVTKFSIQTRFSSYIGEGGTKRKIEIDAIEIESRRGPTIILAIDVKSDAQVFQFQNALGIQSHERLFGWIVLSNYIAWMEIAE